MAVLAARDLDDVEQQLAGVAGLRAALLDLGLDGDADERAGQAAVLGWALGQRDEAPVTLGHRGYTAAAAVDEYAAAGRRLLDPDDPAYRYCRGAFEAIRWLQGVRSEPLFDL